MRNNKCFVTLAVASVLAGLTFAAALAASSVSMQRDGTVQIAGHSLKCGNVRNVIDRRLPNLGMAGPGILSLNPGLLQSYSATVRLFVYHHECGHHHVGGDELRADCWAINRGLRDGWLTKASLADICLSFGNDPETETHPSGRRRCRALERCYAAAATAFAREKGNTSIARSNLGGPVGESPSLLYGPKLVRGGREHTPPLPERPHR